jgi:hypothetical protein
MLVAVDGTHPTMVTNPASNHPSGRAVEERISRAVYLTPCHLSPAFR